MILSRLPIALGMSALCLSLFFSSVAHAAAATALSAGSRIKASGASVYYFSADGRRYAFPDLATYRSWYPDFNNIQMVSDTDLALIPLGGLVTIRPGTSMIKITTDPKVYAISRGAVLHWVKNEELARALYGTEWNKQILDVPDAFFTNYHIREDISVVSDLSPSAERTESINIDHDLTVRRTNQQIPTVTPLITPTVTTTSSVPIIMVPTTSTPIVIPTPTSTSPSAILPVAGRLDVLNSGPFTAGDTITVLATVTRGFADRIVLSLSTSTLPSICTRTPCRAEIVLPNVPTTTTLTLQAIFELNQGTSLITNTSTAEIIVRPNAFSSLIRVTAPSRVIYGTNRDIQAEADASVSARTIELTVDGVTVKTCNLVQFCSFTEQENAAVGAQRRVGAIVTDREFRRIFSDITTFEVVR